MSGFEQGFAERQRFRQGRWLPKHLRMGADTNQTRQDLRRDAVRAAAVDDAVEPAAILDVPTLPSNGSWRPHRSLYSTPPNGRTPAATWTRMQPITLTRRDRLGGLLHE